MLCNLLGKWGLIVRKRSTSSKIILLCLSHFWTPKDFLILAGLWYPPALWNSTKAKRKIDESDILNFRFIYWINYGNFPIFWHCSGKKCTHKWKINRKKYSIYSLNPLQLISLIRRLKPFIFLILYVNSTCDLCHMNWKFMQDRYLFKYSVNTVYRCIFMENRIFDSSIRGHSWQSRAF